MSTNHPGLGTEYEILAPAYFALVLNNDATVEDFQIRHNVKNFGNMDDLLIEIQVRDRGQLKFAFQLKHKEKKYSKVLPSSFTSKGDFNIEKYSKTFKNLTQENQQYNFILYTNKAFDPERATEVTNFKMAEDRHFEFAPFFNTSPGLRDIYRFEPNDATEAEFFSKFRLFTNQNNFENFEKRIFGIFKNVQVGSRFITLFRKWHQGKFTNAILDKATLNIQILDIFLSAHISTKPKILSLETAVRQFDVTIFDEVEFGNNDTTVAFPELAYYMTRYKMDLQKLKNSPNEAMAECLVRLAKEYKIVDKSQKQLKHEEQTRIFDYFFEKLLVVRFNEYSKDLIYGAMELYRVTDNRIKFVLVGRKIETSKFPNLKIFQNLRDLQKTDDVLYQKIAETSRLSIQGRNGVSLNTMISFHQEIVDFVQTGDLLEMSQADYQVGENKEVLPQNYMPRMVSTVALNIKSVLSHVLSTATEMLIINCEGKFELIEGLIKENNLQVSDLDDYHAESTNLIVSKNRKCTKSEFDRIHEMKKTHNLYLVRILNKTTFMWMTTTRSTLKQCKSGEFYSLEGSIYSNFYGPVNVVCAQPGMGKSTMLRYLRNSCSSEFWVIWIDLKTHNSFFKENHRGDELLRHFMKQDGDSFVVKLKNLLLAKKKIVLFFDGLDEIENSSVDNVLSCVNELSTDGFSIWVSSRLNLQEKLEDQLNVFPINIKELNREQQEKYVKDRLQEKYNEQEMASIVETIFNSTDVTNNGQVLGIPLQLSMITEIFLEDRRHFEKMTEDMFVLSKMYKEFFKGKYKFLNAKRGLENQHLEPYALDDCLEKYEIPAVQSCFSDKIFQELGLDLRRSGRFLEEFRKKGDPLGIIVRLSAEGKAVFEHHTLAEYFTGVFLSRNFTKTRLLQRHLFGGNHQNLMLILNIILAEDCPLHLAVIYKNIDEIKSHLHNAVSHDEAKRNPLHLACCLGTRHPLLKCDYHMKQYKISDGVLSLSFKGETSTNKTILKLLSGFDPFQKDELFAWNSLNYALASECLFPFEHFLKDLHKNFLADYDDATVAYYSARFGYPNLLALIPDVVPIIMKTRWESTLLHLAVKDADDNTYVKTISMLIDKGVDVKAADYDGKTALHFAANKRRLDAVNILIENNASITATDNYKNTVLHEAAKSGNVKIIEMLVKKSDVDAKNAQEKTALHFAASKGYFDTVKLLVESGANVNASDDYTVLHNVAKSGDVKLIELLVRNGAEVNAKNSQGKSALHLVAIKGFFDAVKLLIDNGASVDAIDDYRCTVLHKAAKSGNVKIMGLLLEMGADVNARNTRGEAALHLAASKRRFDAVKLLVEKGASVNAIDNSGNGVLHCVALNGNVSIMDLLLKKDVNVNARNVDGKTALELAVDKQNLDAVNTLSQYNALDGDGIVTQSDLE